MGVIFYCPTHEAIYNKTGIIRTRSFLSSYIIIVVILYTLLLNLEEYHETFKCDVCSSDLQEEKWWTCLPCSDKYFSTFDLCPKVISRNRSIITYIYN